MNIKEIKELMDLLKHSEVSELEIERDGVKIKLKKGSTAVITPAQVITAQPMVAQPQIVPQPQINAAKEAASKTETKKEEKGLTINSPMVGTFYRAPAPDAAQYVKEGDIVAEGKTVCIIEAMKLMNEIKSEIKGKIVKILVENGQPVEFGQPLFLVEAS